MFQNNQISIDEFIKLTNAGLRIATFTQVRSALIERYKSIYGSDIDLSTGSADGVFVNDLALIINNILQSVNLMYANLDVETASGVYLDTLCALSNVTRKQATNSIAYLNVTNTAQTQQTFSPEDLIFVDKSGIEWLIDENYTFNPGQTLSIKVTCSEEGTIHAPKGWIYQTLDASQLLNVEQPNDAIIGSKLEDDNSLRARRAQSSSSAGITTLSSLTGALLDISGVRDVKLFNNNTDEDDVLSDGSTLSAHSIYVALRLEDGVNVPDSTIGNLIYEKMTPGIHSCECLDSSAIAKTYTYIADVADIHQTILNQLVYWKQAQPISPEITIIISPYSYFTTDEFPSIVNSIITYINSLPLNTTVDDNELLVQTIYADPTFKGKATYAVVTATSDTHTNDITYYSYSRYSIPCTGTVSGNGHTYEITDAVFTIEGIDFTIYNNCVIDENLIKYDLTNNTFVYNSNTYTLSNIQYTKSGEDYIITLGG